LPFPFSDLSSSKKRPALVLSDLQGEDIILCQITSQKISDQYSIDLDEEDIVSGKLIKKSNIRCSRIFTADKSIILYRIGAISHEKFAEVRNQIVGLLDQQ